MHKEEKECQEYGILARIAQGDILNVCTDLTYTRYNVAWYKMFQIANIMFDK